MHRLWLVPAALVVCGGMAHAQTSSNEQDRSSPSHSMVQQGERHESPSNPHTASSYRRDHRDSAAHSMMQEGERHGASPANHD
jgi:Ni/Co efflux regulator RcnB